MKKIYLLLLLLVTSLPTFAQNLRSLQGDWKGAITIMGNQLPITTHFTGDDSLSGTINVQGATLPLQNIRTTETDSVYFEFTTSVNVAKFHGAFKNDSTITGQFHQAGQQFAFKIKRVEPADEAARAANQPPLPYHHKDLIIKNDSIAISGTLTWPKDDKPETLVIMISGSGAQDRDETLAPISKFGPFALLADSLTAAGIATFRYDDRGIGQSTGSFANATLDILASDVDAIIHYFKNSPDQKFDTIILLGHSQGGIVGGKVAAANEAVDNLILMASTGVILKKVTDFQVREAMKRGGLNKQQIAREMAARNQLISALKHQQNVAQAKRNHTREFFKLLQNFRDSTTSTEELEKAAQQESNGLVASYNNPQFKSLLYYDPTNDLKKLTIPVLVLFGGKDQQVTVAMNKIPIEQALVTAGAPHKILVFDDANHPFQKATTGDVSEYGSLPPKFVDGFTQAIIRWINENE